MVTRTTTEAANAEHVESLDDIAALGNEMETVTVDPKEAAADLRKETLEITSALQLLRAAAIPFAPEHVQEPLGQVWSDKQLEVIAQCIVDLCRVHGLTVGDFFQLYGPYINLAMALGLPAMATLKLLRMPAISVTTHAERNGQQQPA